MKEYIIELSDNENALSILVKAYNLHELVRCKDCKHVCLCDAEEMFPDMPVYAKCTLTDEVHEPEWFCADGEARKDGNV